MTDTPKLGLTYVDAAQSQKHVTVNDALRKFDTLVQPAVKDKNLTTPPATPANGDAYIVPTGATGVWASAVGKVAAWYDNAWFFYTPREGWRFWVDDEDTEYVYTGSVWAIYAVSGGGGGSITVKDEGSDLTTVLTSLDFVGAGVTATNTGGDVTVTISGGGGGTFSDTGFTLQDNADTTKQLQFQLSGITTGTMRTLTVPDVTGTIALLNGTQTFAGDTTVSGTFTASNATVTLGTAVTATTVGLGTGVTTTGVSKAVNVGTGGASGSTTTVEIGSSTVGALGATNVRSPTVFLGGTVLNGPNVVGTISQLGLGGATPDATNRLSINTPAVLLNNAGSSIDMTYNKNAAGNDASLSFKTDFSARALVGTLGDDNFTIKVSPDGSSFFSGLTVIRTTGKVRADLALNLNPVAGDLASPVDGDVWYNSTTGKFRAQQASSTVDLIGTGGGLSDGDKGDVVISSGGTDWTVTGATGNFTSGGNIQGNRIGLGTAASGTYVLAAAGALSQLSHDGAGHTLRIGKATLSDTASIALQSSGSTRAEIGIIGSSSFVLRTSPDGTAFVTALTAAAADGAVTLHKPVLLEGQASDPGSPSNGTLWYDSTRGDLKARVDGATRVISRQDHVPFLVPPAGEYILTTAGLGGAAATTLAGAANRLEIFQWSPGADVSIDRLLINCTTAVAAAEVKIVVYSADENGRPDALLYETAALSVATTGQKFEAVALDFLKGRTYWLGIRHSLTATVSAWASTSTPDINGGTAISTSARKTLRRTLAFATAAPNPWVFASSEINPGPATAIWIRLA